MSLELDLLDRHGVRVGAGEGYVGLIGRADVEHVVGARSPQSCCQTWVNVVVIVGAEPGLSTATENEPDLR